MITLDREQLKTLVNDPSTRATLHGLYKWQDDVGVLYSEKLQLLENEAEVALETRRDQAVQKVLWSLQRWSENYNYVEVTRESLEEFLEALLERVLKGKSPDAWVWPDGEPIVYLRKYPQIVHNKALCTREYSETMVEALKAFSWVDRGRLSDYLEGSKFDWTPAELGVLTYVLKHDTLMNALTEKNFDVWQHRYEEFMPDLISHIRVPEFAQAVHDTAKDKMCSIADAEAIVAMCKADELLWKFSVSVAPELRYNEERFKGYKAYTLCVGSLRRVDTQFLGRVVAWDRSIKTNGDDSLMLASVWEPGKQKDAQQYYLVKE